VSRSIFNHIGDISYKKTPIDSYTDMDWKSYSPYMVNRWVSMNPAAIELANLIQKHYSLDKKIHYKFYSDVLPKQKMYMKYIKGNKNIKYDPELIDIVCKHYEISKSETKSYLDLVFSKKLCILELKEMIMKYGHNDKAIKKLIKVKK
jgi:hypothetical protein